MMINNKKVLALITARGGSKGIPDKNIKLLGGKPLVTWTIEAAKASTYIDRLIISTDSLAISDIAKEAGCEVPFRRPADLAQDHTPSMDVILHALDSLKEAYSYLVLLQPTSPFRSTYQIDDAIEKVVKNEHPVMVSVSRCHSHPNFIYELKDNTLFPVSGKISTQLRRQDLPDTYEHNGSLYIADIDYLRRHKSFNTPDAAPYIINDYSSVDIDTPEDWRLAELIAAGLRQTET